MRIRRKRKNKNKFHVLGNGEHNQPSKKPRTQQQTSSQTPVPQCTNCGKLHSGECRKLNGGCFKCGEIGHRVNKCPKGQLQQQQKNSGNDNYNKHPTKQGSEMWMECKHKNKNKIHVNGNGEHNQPSKKPRTQQQTSSQTPIPQCVNCGKWHSGKCRKLNGGCFKCREVGHRVNKCPKGQLQQQQKNSGDNNNKHSTKQGSGSQMERKRKNKNKSHVNGNGEHNQRSKKLRTQQQTSSRTPLPQCANCGKWHSGKCCKLNGGCFKCGEVGHYVNKCPKGQLKQQQKNSGNDNDKKHPTKQNIIVGLMGGCMQEPSGGLNKQEKSGDDVESNIQTEELSEKQSEEPSELDEHPSEETGEEPSIESVSQSPCSSDNNFMKGCKQEPSGGSNKQENSSDNVGSITQTEELSEKQSEEPCELDEYPSEETGEEPSIESFSQSPCSGDNNDMKGCKQEPSGGSNKQEQSGDDVESNTQTEELSEKQSEEPSELDEHPSEETGEEPSIESFSQSPSSSDNNDMKHQSRYVQADLVRNESSLDISSGWKGSLQAQSQKKQESSMQSGSEFWPAIANPLNRTTASDEDSSQQQEKTSSEKRRQSRWEPQLGADMGAVEVDGTCKRRKTRWACDDSQSKILDHIQLPDFVKNLASRVDLDPKIRDLRFQLLHINTKLRGTKVFDDRLEEERSPSPPPVYNNLGIRINSREVRLREKLIEERQDIILRLIQKDPTFIPPEHYRTPKLYKKLYIPVNKYPGYNFIGLILGPRGTNARRMEEETGARIHIRGKNSKYEKFWQGMGNKSKSLSNLHVLMEADTRKSLDAAVGMVEKLLVPAQEVNELKRAQLKELAKLNGTLEDGNSCGGCDELGHMQHVCPGRNSTLKVDALCQVCGGDHPSTNCPLTASDSGNKMGSQFHGVFSSIGSGSAVFGVSPIPSSSKPERGRPESLGSLCFSGLSSNTGIASTAAPEGKPNKEIDDSNLYVCHLPPELDVGQLIKLFSPFGKITSATVIEDSETGLSKGFGFVKYAEPANAAIAVEHMNRYKIDGKMLAVSVVGRPLAVPPSLESARTTSIKLLPPYPGSQSVPQDNPDQPSWPRPPGAMLSEPCASFSKSNALSSPPVGSGETDHRQLSSHYRSNYSIISSPCTLAPFPSYLTLCSDYPLCGDSVKGQLSLSFGSSKIPIPTTSMLSQIPGNLSSTPSYLGQSDLFTRHSPLSYRSSYDIPVSSLGAHVNVPDNVRSSPRHLAQADSFNRQLPSYWSSY